MVIGTGSIVFDDGKRDYEVLELIGHGGFGQVYRCQQHETKEFRAVKTLPSLFTDPKTLGAFKNDARMATRLSHPNVIRYEFFHDGEQYPTLPPYILMEGKNLCLGSSPSEPASPESSQAATRNKTKAGT
jgi:eukaryotic-like serine/threonine-protein kinase